ncbi:MAG: SurA N-terminal domain-containing protein [Variovorax sp.]
MFDFIRKHNKLMLVVLFLLVIPSFVLFGVERYTNSTGGVDTVASIGDEPISRQAWDARHRQEIDRIREQNPSIDPGTLDSDVARYLTLEQMVRERVLAHAAAAALVTVPDQQLTRLFSEDPALAQFRNADGKFDRRSFELATRQTPEQYEAQLRSQLATQQVVAGIADSAFVSRPQAEAALGAIYDQREIQVARFKPADYRKDVEVSDEELKRYYDAHLADFAVPDQVDAQYVVLDLDAVKKKMTLSDADVAGYYEQNKTRYGVPEERRSRHILIAMAPDAPAADQAKAKAKAEQLLAEVRKDPTRFADLARTQSQDPASGEKGGDLDFVQRGAMVKPFDDALFSMGKGDMAVVKTDFGYHVIEMTDIRPSSIAPLTQVRAQVENDIRTQRAPAEFSKAAETFRDLVYQEPDSLKPAADKLGLQIQRADNLGRVPTADAKGASPALAALTSRSFLAALFSPDSLEKKHNTEAIDLGASQLASGRIERFSAAHTKPLADVKDEVQKSLLDARFAKAAEAEGMAKLKAWEADPAAAKLEPPVVVSRRNTANQPLPLLEAALRSDTAKLPVWAGVDLGAEGYAVVRVNKNIEAAALPEDRAAQERAQVVRLLATAESDAYYKLLRDRLGVKVDVPMPSTLRANRGAEDTSSAPR